MSAVALELERYGSQIGEETVTSAAARIPLNSIMNGPAPLVSAYDGMPEELLEALANGQHVDWITDLNRNNAFTPEMVVIRPGALVGTVLATMASVGDSGSWLHRAMYVAGILVALGSYLRATAVKLSREEGQVTLIIYMLSSSGASKHVGVTSVLSALNTQLADYNMPTITESRLRAQLQILTALGILRLDAAADTVCLQDKVIEL